MASRLHNKINSYAIEKGIEFGNGVAWPEIETGSLAQSVSNQWTLTGSSEISSDSPLGGDNSRYWYMSTPRRERIGVSGGNSWLSSIVDHSFSLGFWFKLNSATYAPGTQLNIFQVGPITNGGFVFFSPTNAVGFPELTTVFLTYNNSSGTQQIPILEPVQLDTWYYAAFVRNDSSMSIYIDGTLKTTITDMLTATQPTAATFGGPAIIGIEPTYRSVNMSNFYIAPASVIAATEISEIWNVGSSPASINVSVLADVLTASSNSPESLISGSANIDAISFFIYPIGIEPTIITTTSNSVNIATSIPVNARLVEPESSLSISVDIGTTLNASANAVDPVFGVTTPVYIYETPMTASIKLQENITVVANRQINIFATAYELTARLVTPPTVISDNEIIFAATRMTASAEIPLPDFGTPSAPPLYYTPGTLKSKIATYAIQTGTEFNTNVASISNVTSYGTLPSTFSAFNTFDLTGYTPVYDPTDGPFASGTGCWKLANSRTRTTLQAGISSDLNYTLGIWFKLPTLSTGTANEGMRLFTLGTSTVTSTSLDFSVSLTGSSHTTQPSKLAVSLNGTTYDYLTTPVNTTEWYYLAVRRTGSAGVNNFEVYINGELKLVKTNSDTSATYSSFHIGNNGASANGGSIKFQNFHATTATTLTSYEINQIWLAGTQFPPAQSVNAVHSADRLLATALSMSPTIVSTKGDHIEVTTSVTVSSFLPEPSWSTGNNVKFNTGFFGGIEAEMGDNVQVETNGDKSITPEAFLSSAILVEPILSRQPAKANASLPMPAVYTAPNYFSLVTVHQPVFYIEDGQATPNNYGSWQATGWESQYIDVNVQSGQEMNAVGNQKSWMANANSIILRSPKLQANIPDYRTKINDLYASRNLTIEIWYTSIGYGSTTNTLAYEESGPIFNDGITQITEVWDFFGCVPGSDPQNKIMLIGERLKSYDFSNLAGAFATWRSFPDANPKRDEWNHLVVTYESVTNPQQIRRKIYLNSGIVSNQLLTIANSSLNPGDNAFADDGFIDISLDQPQNIFSGPQIGGGIQLSGSQTIKLHDGVKVDEFAIYPKTLSGTQVVEHYNFIKSLSPDTRYNSTVTEFRVEIGNHQVIPVQNTIFDEDPMPALAARIPEPVIIGGKSKTIAPDESEASALIVNPSVTTNSILDVDPMRTNAELLLPSISNNYYYQYVQSNIAPYRYVSFDTNVEYQDHGTDNDYSVIPTTINGIISQYKDSINNKSVITSGNSYQDGVILNESEWNDSWGTGANDWHSAFWFERAESDQSTTGLRVLWNLNGYKDNQHAVLYQYQGRLHMQFNNGSGTFIETDSTALDLFDYQRHFIVIDHNHGGGNNNTIKLYVDSVLRFTVNIGSITPTTTNAATADSGPNHEANNRARLSVGCLITPFGSTALPVQPTTTKLIIDEVYWDKNVITQTQVTNLYNAMPIKTKSRNYATPLTANVLIVESTTSTSINFEATAMLAFPAQTEPTITTVYSILIQTDSMDATTDINDAVRSDSRNIVAGVFLATFGLGSAGTPRIVNATPLTASLNLVNRTVTGVQTGQGNGILINGQRTFDPNSKWVQYVLSTTENTLIPMREVR